MKRSHYHQGKYEVKNKEKYIGSGTPIYRSGWEKKVFWYLDSNQNVLKWASEPFSIPYQMTNPKTGAKEVHNYWPDIYAEIQTRDGTIIKYLYEIKPKAQTVPPKPPKNKNNKARARFLNEAATYAKNISKWKFASAFCKKNGIKFDFITEDNILLK